MGAGSTKVLQDFEGERAGLAALRQAAEGGGAKAAPADAAKADAGGGEEEQDDTGIVVEIVKTQLKALQGGDLEAANKVAHPSFKIKEALYDDMMKDQFKLFGDNATIEYCEGTYTEAPPGPPHFCAKMCLVSVTQQGGIGMVDYVKCQMDRKSDNKWTVAEWQQDPPEEG